ncbi:hypothetical protein DFO77_10772 [Marinilabilia salmonicolor]|uniref:Uncharacterized protein n=1 Tax=Marinilabilia salmonicolor TaxID=989 RepID=A0A368VCS7_9BACT|nr:hypothetical protein DFO77_10772 [Marinilabilia salmonicolor]
MAFFVLLKVVKSDHFAWTVLFNFIEFEGFKYLPVNQ